MATVEPGKGRAIIERDGATLRITIPAKTRRDVAAFLVLWLIGWALGEVLVARDLLAGRFAQDPTAARAFGVIIWLAFWTVMGFLAFHWLLWQLAGKEIIELTAATLRQRKVIPFYSRSREFAVESIANLRPTPPLSWFRRLGYRLPGLDFKEGAITFDYGRTTCCLGQGLGKADAQHVIREMCKRVRSLCVSGDDDGQEFDAS